LDIKIGSITRFGLVFKLDEGVEGWLSVEEMDLDPEQKIEEFYETGDSIKVKVLNFDDERREINLTQKESSGE